MADSELMTGSVGRCPAPRPSLGDEQLQGRRGHLLAKAGMAPLPNLQGGKVRFARPYGQILATPENLE
jgi:hypothetical protein